VIDEAMLELVTPAAAGYHPIGGHHRTS